MNGESGAEVRARAAQALSRVLDGATLETALSGVLEEVPLRDRALARELCAGSLRHYPRLDGLLTQMLDRPPRRKDRVVRALAITGIYQLAETRIPAHAAVNATVAAVTVLDRRHARALVNAVLRRYQRDAAGLEAALPEAARHAHPPWLWSRLGEQWPQQRLEIADANNTRPPMTLRVNTLRSSRESYAADLQTAGIDCVEGMHSETALRLATPSDVHDLPGFAQGACSVQDETAQLAAHCLDLRPGLRVLDACAAPGGKTCHMLEICPELELTAMDVSAERLRRVDDNLRRLNLNATLREGDARNAQIFDHTFDVVVVDAPCSATGVIRRHPDIKVLRRREDLVGFASQQLAILKGVWPLLAAGGELLYVTCSILREENSDVVAAFLADRDDAEEVPLSLPGAFPGGYPGAHPGDHPGDHGQQILPRVAGGDGLYFAKLAKAPVP
ncbi:MAG: 16S rRNA (cytosine(967)-C(5))-methyltransferase RsmB [Pseudomonadota bacterium]